jgi:hypothetical protein
LIKIKIPQNASSGTWPVTVVIQAQPVKATDNFRVIVPPIITEVKAQNDLSVAGLLLSKVKTSVIILPT